MEPASRIFAAVLFIQKWGACQGGHHKQWVIDQVLRILLEDFYDEWVVEYNADEDYGDWDVGIAP